ncbi:DNA polymerase lambda [Lasiodiplodia theobromae]|uniref:DNA polymerase n=1 Tax=Lasiodiplodia theobromae TaxID=45133 RepID=A0A5N5DLJ9_9PEZI|nr:DNA polymerase lambda [Lasiodiplodia theobromae]
MFSAKRKPMQLKRSLDQLKQMPRALSKGKKDSKIKLVPESRRVFKDLVFFFFPNNDINLARRRRIAKAIEYGASWVVEWCDDITHVIVDRDLQFEHLTTHLKIDALPQHIVVVNENYPADCIMYLDIIDHKQPQYRIQGYELSDARSVGAQSSNPLSVSKGVAVAQSTIPPKSKESNTEHTQHAPSAQDNQGPEQKDSAEGSATSGVYADALEDIIAGAKNADYLPLKPLDLEDEDSSPQTSDIEDSDTEDERPKKVAKTSVDQHAGSSEQFQCMKKNDGKTKDTNANARTIEVLTQMGHYYEKIKDEWRSRAYRKAISVLRKQDRKITTKEEAIQLPCIGSRLAATIEEIVWTNRLRRLDNARLEPGDEALQTFLKIYGVGLSKASKWVMAGLRTLDDLKSYGIPLTPAQQVGLTHYSDFNTRIPRDEVTQHAAVVRAALQAIDPACTATVGGSYRRGALDSGDIDVLISHPTADLARLQQIVFDVLVPALTASGFLKVALATHRSGSGSRANNTVDCGTKWHGVSALPATNHEKGKKGDGIWRRIDLLLVPEPQLGAALIYFTGNDIFNRSIRLLASRKGMRLNQRGLYKDVLRGWGREKITEGELVEGRSEKRIFDVLGVPWRPPEHRIC